ncbi:hypothetical protein C1H46_007231 [Malus baccata]|uniref:Uncharacterized protein n=1 Tax=Malus baccata TaxID=106549 RepID=A0A540N7Z5_MALBA|nr:hypothetical protein C1H46_007231 [Malus baccata]
MELPHPGLLGLNFNNRVCVFDQLLGLNFHNFHNHVFDQGLLGLKFHNRVLLGLNFYNRVFDQQDITSTTAFLQGPDNSIFFHELFVSLDDPKLEIMGVIRKKGFPPRLTGVNKKGERWKPLGVY